MQLNDLQDLVSKLKENKDMQVETTTLGKFLGTESNQVAMVLGKEILNRPMIVSTREDNIQLLDLKTGFIISLSHSEKILPKLVKTFSKVEVGRPKMVTSVENKEEEYREIIRREVPPPTETHAELRRCRDTMYESGSIEDRVSLIEKTIKILDSHKCECCEAELPKITKAQDKLNKMVGYARSNKLAPGQIPCVYEIAIWSWVKE
jgi:hypothetical protein